MSANRKRATTVVNNTTPQPERIVERRVVNTVQLEDRVTTWAGMAMVSLLTLAMGTCAAGSYVESSRDYAKACASACGPGRLTKATQHECSCGAGAVP